MTMTATAFLTVLRAAKTTTTIHFPTVLTAIATATVIPTVRNVPNSRAEIPMATGNPISSTETVITTDFPTKKKKKTVPIRSTKIPTATATTILQK